MDPSEVDDADIASALGFSSFGAQDRPQKKRRFNQKADAYVDTGSKPTRPSGARVATGANAAKVNLGDDDDGGSAAARRAKRWTATADESSEAQALPSTLPPRPAGLPSGPAEAPDQEPHQHPQLDHRPRGSGEGESLAFTPWYEGYYDPMSNENPWERLEKSMGLQPKGVWIARAVAGST